KRRSSVVRRLLKKLYPDAHCELDFRNPFELLCATILSAQCTDVQVNKVTPALFARFPTPSAMADADPAELETLIRSTGFYRNKAKNLLACCRTLVDDFSCDVPRTMPELLQLAGVARKTANVVLGNAFGVPGLPVDTHVQRLSFRLGFTNNTDPVKIEVELNALAPKSEWTMLSHRLIFHGRRVCFARKPNCAECLLAPHCPKRGVADQG
ncbi:MAG: endonuclease III, partial [Planctomycetia bacterium]